MALDSESSSLLIRGILAILLFVVLLAIFGALTEWLERLLGDRSERVQSTSRDAINGGLSRGAPYGTASRLEAGQPSNDPTPWP